MPEVSPFVFERRVAAAVEVEEVAVMRSIFVRPKMVRALPLPRICGALVPLLLAGTAAAPAGAAFDAAAVFEAKCSSCHSVGRGVVVGPDLAGVTARHDRPWLYAFVRSSQTVIRGGDAAAVALYARFQRTMPDHPMSDGEIETLLAFIEAGGPARRDEVRHAADATAAEVARGRDLFLGTARLERGGAACVGCHAAGPARLSGGSTLAADLTGAYRLYRDWGLTRALAEPRGRLMAALYRDRPLTEEEAFALKAFLRSVAPPSPLHVRRAGVLGLGDPPPRPWTAAGFAASALTLFALCGRRGWRPGGRR